MPIHVLCIQREYPHDLSSREISLLTGVDKGEPVFLTPCDGDGDDEVV